MHQIIERADLVLRRLHLDVVDNAVGRIEKESRLRLLATRKRQQNILGHVGGTDAYALQAGTVHLQRDPGLIQSLVDMHIDGPIDGLDPVHELSGKYSVLGNIIAVYLYIDCRGNTKIENLGHDIGRLKEELDTRETLAEFRRNLF